MNCVSRVVLAASAGMFAVSCTQQPTPTPQEVARLDVYATHEPMHPANNSPVTFRAVAAANTISLKYERFALAVAPDGTLTQTSAGPVQDLKVCNGSGAELTCTHSFSQGFPASSLVRFDVAASKPDGSSGSESYFLAAGDYPIADGAVPVRLKTGTTEGLDLVFIGTSDLGPEVLRRSLQDIVHKIYFKYDQLRQWRGVYNFYYSRVAGDYQEGCDFTNPDNMAVLEATGDAVVFVHQAEMRDCKYGKRISSEVWKEKSMVHETGHVLFDLQDEYCCDSNYFPQSCEANLWNTKALCEAAAPGLNYPVSACAQLVNTSGTTRPFWRVDPIGETGCIMGDGQHNPGSTFRTACERRILWRHQKCVAGRCFTTPVCP